MNRISSFHLRMLQKFEDITTNILKERIRIWDKSTASVETNMGLRYFDGTELSFPFKIYIESTRTRKGGFG